METALQHYPVFFADQDGIILSCSAGAKLVFGYEDKEIIGKSMDILHKHGDNEQSVIENLQKATTHKTYEAEAFQVKKDGSYFKASISYTPIYINDNELLGFTAVTQPFDNNISPTQPFCPKPEVAVPTAVITGNIQFKKLIENSHEGYTFLDAGLGVIYRSRSASRISGWSNDDRAKTPMESLIHPDDRQMVNVVLKQVLDTPGKPIFCTCRTKHYDGHFIWVECVYTNFLNDPDINAIVCNFEDVSEKKQAEELLRQTVKELGEYKYALDDSAIVAITDQKGIIRHVNENFCRISKYTKEELVGQDHRIINSGYHSKAFIKKLWITIANGKIWKGELKNKAKDGTFYWVDTTIVPFLNEEGKPYQYIAIRSDITERKLNEEKIIANAGFIQTVTDNVPALIAYWTADLHCLFANKPHLEWFDKTMQEMRNITKKELLGKDEFELHKIHIQKVLEGQPQSFERAFHNNNGKTIYTQTQYLPDWNCGVVKGFYSLIYDVTEVKRAHQEINTKTEQIEALLDDITDGFISLDDQFCYTYANKQVTEMLGRPVESLLGKNIWELFPDAVGSATYNAIQTAYKEKKFVCNEDYYAPLNLWQENRVYPSDIGVSIFIRDITNRKQQELQKTLLANISAIFNKSASLGPAMTDMLSELVNFGTFDIGEVWLTGSDKKKINLLSKFYTDEKMEQFYTEGEAIKSFVRGEGLPGIVWKTKTIQFWENVDVHESFKRKKAAAKVGLKTLYGIPLKDNDEIIGVLVLGFNAPVVESDLLIDFFTRFSEQIGAEIKRKQLEEELSQVFNFAPDIICISGVDGYFKKINPAMCVLLGYTELELLSRPFTDFIHPNDKVITEYKLEEIGKGKTTQYFENRYITKTGIVKWLAWTTTPVFEEGLTFCVAKDITDKKELEQLLNNANNLARIGAWEINMLTGVVSWSKITKEIHEVEPEFEPTLESAMAFYKIGEDRDLINKKVKEAYGKGTSYDVELQIITKKNNIKWVKVMGEAEIANGKCIRIYGSFQDIDARKRAEEVAE